MKKGDDRNCHYQNLKELNLSNFELREDCRTIVMLIGCKRLHTLRLDNCNEGTINKIIKSVMFPTGEAEDYEGTRKIYCKKENAVGSTPDGWEFIDGKWYYFSEVKDSTEGMMLSNTTTPDGYQVGADGAWIQ